MIDVRIAQHGIFAHYVKAPDIFVRSRIHNLNHGQSRLVRQLGIPRFLEFLMNRFIIDLLIPAVHIWQSAEVACPLNVILPAQRIHSRKLLSDISCQHRKVGQRKYVVRSRSMLGDAH